MSRRLAIVATHPVQYYAPWFAFLAQRIDLMVFYLWDFGVAAHVDPGFGVPVRWDIPLLEGYEHEFVPNRSRRPGSERFFGLWNPALPGRLREYAPEAVLLTGYNFASMGNLLWQWRRRDPPLIFRGDSHRLYPVGGLPGRAKRGVVSAVFRRFAALLYVGAANREYYRIHGVSDERLFHSPHAVDNQRFIAARGSAEAQARDWKRALGIPEDHRVVLFAGKFEEKKRPLDLLRAFLDARLERASLLFVGSGPKEPELRALAHGRHTVHFAPFQNQTEMPRTYAAGDLLVLPSFGPHETWGLAVNEAMCMGRAALVSSHVGCAADLVIPGETGLRFEAGNIGALRDALRSALSDEARLKAWGENASARIAAYSYEAAWTGLRQALHFAVAGRAR